MRGQKNVSPSEQILRFVENHRDYVRDSMQMALAEKHEIDNSFALGAFTALDSVAEYIRALLRERR